MPPRSDAFTQLTVEVLASTAKEVYQYSAERLIQTSGFTRMFEKLENRNNKLLLPEFEKAFGEQYPDFTADLDNQLTHKKLVDWFIGVNDALYHSTLAVFTNETLQPTIQQHPNFSATQAFYYPTFFLHRAVEHVMAQNNVNLRIRALINSCSDFFYKHVQARSKTLLTDNIAINADIARALISDILSTMLTGPFNDAEVTQLEPLFGAINQLRKDETDETRRKKLYHPLCNALEDPLTAQDPAHIKHPTLRAACYRRYLSTQTNIPDRLIYRCLSNQGDMLELLNRRFEKKQLQLPHPAPDYLWEGQDNKLHPSCLQHKYLAVSLLSYIVNKEGPQSNVLEVTRALLELSSEYHDPSVYYVIGALVQSRLDKGRLLFQSRPPKHQALYEALAQLRFANELNTEYLLAQINHVLSTGTQALSSTAYTLAIGDVLSQIIIQGSAVTIDHFRELAPDFNTKYCLPENEAVDIRLLQAFCQPAIDTQLLCEHSQTSPYRCGVDELNCIVQALDIGTDASKEEHDGATSDALKTLQTAIFQRYRDPRPTIAGGNRQLPQAPKELLKVAAIIESPLYTLAQKEALLQQTAKAVKAQQEKSFSRIFSTHQTAALRNLFRELAQGNIHHAAEALRENQQPINGSA